MIKSVVKEVNVYRRKATVRREAAIELKQGENTVIVQALSATASEDSVRLFLPDGVLQTDMQIVYAKDQEDTLPSAEKQTEIDRLQAKIDLLGEMKDLWKSNGNFESRGEVGSGAVIEYLSALPERLISLEEEIDKLREQKKALEKEKEELTKQEKLPLLRLVLEAPSDMKAQCIIEYVENAASWESVYEVHTNTDSDQLEILSKGRIVQATQEDWNDVSVNLFTGNPSGTSEIPELDVIELEIAPEIQPRRNFAARGKANARMLSDEACVEVAEEEGAAPMMAMGSASFDSANMNMAEAEESDADTMTCFKLPGKRSVPKGKAGTIAEIKKVILEAEKRIIGVPKLDSSAYLAAMIPTAKWPLKPSNAKIYLSGNYCGEVYIDPDMTEEIFMLSLGTDERIDLSRETKPSKTEDVLLKGQKRKNHEFEIRVTNSSAKSLDVIIWDQIPLSGEKQIVIDRVNLDGATFDEEAGKLTWNLKLEPGTTVTKRFGYTLAWPKDKRTRETYHTGKSGTGKCPNCGAYGTGKICAVCGKPLEEKD